MVSDTDLGRDRKIRVLIVEDHPMMVDGLIVRLEDKAGMDVCGVARNAKQLRALYGKCRPDVVLCDIRLAGVETGIDVTRELLERHTEASVLMYSAETDTRVVDSAIAAGAVGFVNKQATLDSLVESVTAAAAGERDIYDRVTAAALLRAAHAPADKDPGSALMATLTQRQREILVLMATTGVTATSELAREMFLSEPTIRTHITRMFQALGVSSRGAAIQMAYQSGLVTSAGIDYQRQAG